MTVSLKYVEDIATAPKTNGNKAVLFHRNAKAIAPVEAVYDATWGNGRGAWFGLEGKILNATTWSPSLTQMSNKAGRRKAITA